MTYELTIDDRNVIKSNLKDCRINDDCDMFSLNQLKFQLTFFYNHIDEHLVTLSDTVIDYKEMFLETYGKICFKLLEDNPVKSSYYSNNIIHYNMVETIHPYLRDYTSTYYDELSQEYLNELNFFGEFGTYIVCHDIDSN